MISWNYNLVAFFKTIDYPTCTYLFDFIKSVLTCFWLRNLTIFFFQSISSSFLFYHYKFSFCIWIFIWVSFHKFSKEWFSFSFNFVFQFSNPCTVLKACGNLKAIAKNMNPLPSKNVSLILSPIFLSLASPLASPETIKLRRN